MLERCFRFASVPVVRTHIFDSLLPSANNALQIESHVLAVSLSFSAGVMVFVSFVSIFPKSLESWQTAVGERFALLAAVSCFFGGIGITKLLDLLVHRLDGHNNAPLPSTHADTATVPLRTADELEEDDEDSAASAAVVAERVLRDSQRKQLRRVGWLTSLAMVIHNVPEGMATFVGTLADTRLGAGLAVAIAIHNVPAGICIAMPIFYATGSRWKGLAWASVVGACEPLGALIAYAFLAAIVGPTAFAVLFGIVSGMLAHIAIHESLPTAKRCHERWATGGFIAGMFIIAMSLVLFAVV